MRHLAFIVPPALLAAGALMGVLAEPAAAQTALVTPSYRIGMAEAECRPGEAGPAVIVTIAGLKDRAGNMRAELYPANEDDFLEDDKILARAGKVFRRTEIALPESGPVVLCLRVPAPGNYAMLVLHDRDANRKFGLSSDGVGFPGNPRLGLSKPRAAVASFHVGPGVTNLSIRLNYRRGLLSFGPLRN